jgi:hypothetical protein
MKNPIDGHQITGKSAEYIGDLKAVRAEARRRMRSGNPKVRADAARANAGAPLLIAKAYTQDHAARHGR